MSLDMSELDAIVAPNDEQLKAVAKLAEMQVANEAEVAELEKNLAEAKARLRRISEVDLPDAMAACNLSSFTLADGTKITVNKAVYASISEANRRAAFAWLREHGHGDIIKNEVKVRFGANEDTKAADLVTFLDSSLGVDYDHKPSVHTNTLRAWAREQLEQGNPLPETITVHEAMISKVVKG